MKKRFFCTAMTILLLSSLYACSSEAYNEKDRSVFANGDEKVRFSNGQVEFEYPAAFSEYDSEDFIFRAEMKDIKEYTNFIVVYEISGDIDPQGYINNYMVLNQNQNSFSRETGEFSFESDSSDSKAFYAKIYNNEKGTSQYFTTVIFETAADENKNIILCIQINNEVFSKEIANDIIASFRILRESDTRRRTESEDY